MIYYIGYLRKNQYYSKNPKIGDQIFFKKSNKLCHTGIVYKVDSVRVYTVEGNTSDSDGVVSNGGCVNKKSYKLNSSSIDGYGRPKYSNDELNKLNCWESIPHKSLAFLFIL